MKLCECGCGLPAPVAKRNGMGYQKGEAKRFRQGHHARKYPHGWDEVDTGFKTPCFLWRGERTTDGYPRQSGKLAHRLAYELMHGAIPDELHLDHLCRVRHCVNPDHLEPVTCAENVRRGRNQKLTPEKVKQLKTFKGTHHAAARAVGCSYSRARQIRLGLGRG